MWLEELGVIPVGEGIPFLPNQRLEHCRECYSLAGKRRNQRQHWPNPPKYFHPQRQVLELDNSASQISSPQHQQK